MSELNTAAPALGAERYDLIDALRGFALAGVLLMNLGPLSLYGFLDQAQRAALPTAAFDPWALQIIEWLVETKFATLFSLLFGLSFALQLERAETWGGGALWRFVRRLSVLALIGLAHSYLLWWGDVLLTYALVGFVLIAFRKVSDTWLLLAAAVVILVLPPLLGPWVNGRLPEMASSEQMYAANLEAFSSPSYAAAFVQNARYANWVYLGNSALLFCFVLGRFLLGYWAGRRRLLQEAAANGILLRKIFICASLLGVAMTVAQYQTQAILQTWPVLASGIGRFVLRVAMRIGPLGLGVAYASGFALLFLTPGWHRRLRWLAPVGRMALSNYLIQSLIGVTLFYGFAFDIGPRFGLPGWLAAWVLIFASQVFFSHWWLARFRFGPMEWLWRTLTYGRVQPMRSQESALNAR